MDEARVRAPAMDERGVHAPAVDEGGVRTSATDEAGVRAPEVEERTRGGVNEDWAATIVGLVLLALVLAGVIGKGLVP